VDVLPLFHLPRVLKNWIFFGWVGSNNLRMKYCHYMFQWIDNKAMWINSNMNIVCCNVSFPFFFNRCDIMIMSIISITWYGFL
jgi:hypothetical protein